MAKFGLQLTDTNQDLSTVAQAVTEQLGDKAQEVTTEIERQAQAVGEQVVEHPAYQQTLGKILAYQFLGSTVQQWLIFVALWIVSRWALDLLLSFTQKQLNKVLSRYDGWAKLFSHLLSTVSGWTLGIISFSIACLALNLDARFETIVKGLPVAALLLQIGLWGGIISDFTIQKYLKSKADNDSVSDLNMLAAPMRFMLLLMLWAIVILLTLDNFGINVTALITGLGIGGIAVALAVQNVLGDLLASLSIVLDKPFKLGDFIIVGDFLGTVEHIGLKTTRIRSLGGEQIIISNSDMLSSRVRNYKRMEERRVVFAYGLIYQTTLEQLQAAKRITREVIESIEKTRFDRAHFQKFGASSLDFEVVYYVLDADYNIYMDIQEQINLGLVKEFAKLDIEFAYPTQTLFIASTNSDDKADSSSTKEAGAHHNGNEQCLVS